MSLILNSSQAQAVYDAMCALNNVSADRVSVTFGMVKVIVAPVGFGVTVLGEMIYEYEEYFTQFDFAIAYGIK
mgnify:CR=1 FL=1